MAQHLTSVYTRLTDEVEKSLKYICRKISECPQDVCQKRAHVVVKELLEKLPEIRSMLSGDIEAAYSGDPAAVSTEEVILSYPCVLAITTYRIAHELYLQRRTLDSKNNERTHAFPNRHRHSPRRKNRQKLLHRPRHRRSHRRNRGNRRQRQTLPRRNLGRAKLSQRRERKHHQRKKTSPNRRKQRSHLLRRNTCLEQKQ